MVSNKLFVCLKDGEIPRDWAYVKSFILCGVWDMWQSQVETYINPNTFWLLFLILQCYTSVS